MMIQEVMQAIRVSVRDFARVPGPRFKFQGKNSGEEFYETELHPSYLVAKQTGQKLVVDLDGTEGYTSAFLDQSFGTLARTYGFDEVMKTLEIITVGAPYIESEIRLYMQQKVK